MDLDDLFNTGYSDYRRFVNPLIYGRAELARDPIRIARVEQGCLIDEQGHRIEDFHGTQALGHRHPAITRAVESFLKTDSPSWYPSRVSPYSGRLARRLCERTGYELVWFALTGSDVVDAAMKLARVATGRSRILGLTGAYHGCNYGSTALMAAGPFHDPFGPHLPGCASIPINDTAALQQALAEGDVAAVMVEPIQGEGGVRRLDDDYVEALCGLSKEHGALLIADEIQTSLGRSGKFIYSHHWPRPPEVLLIAKALGGGLVPVSAMLTRDGVFMRAYGSQFEAGESHNTTFSYHALGAVAGLATLDLLTDELIDEVRIKGERFRAGLHQALHGNPLYVETRGDGLMIGVQLKQPDNPWLGFHHFGFPELAARPSIGPLLATRLYPHGFFCFVCGHDWSVLRLQPRFNIEPATLSRFAEACAQELNYLADLD